MSFLPQELIDIVIDHAHNQPETLRACSLVSSTWRPAAQFHLHQRVTLQPKVSPTHTSTPNSHLGCYHRISTLLNTSSHLLPYTRSLIIREGASPWLQRESPGLLTLLERLISSTTLSEVQLHNVEWQYIAFPLQHALLRVLSMRSIQDVSLVECYIPKHIPWTKFVGPETKKLLLDRVRVHGDGVDPNPDSGGAVDDVDKKVDTLSIVAFGQPTTRLVLWIIHPQQAKHTRRFKSLRLSCDRISVEPLNRLVKACSSLEHLRFEPFLFRWDHRDAFPFPITTHNHSLRTLQVSGLYTDQLRWLTAFVGDLTTSANHTLALETVNIDMTAQIPVLLSKDDYLYARIREIDEAAASRKAAGQLNLVCLRLALPGITPDEVGKMAERMKVFGRTLSVVKVDIADRRACEGIPETPASA
ncbi:hypothetical protein EYR38_003359 [Pleurotus pulmonarius]|nr:hypothetical protein EYR38_003359 [Pleurotus pulmonarius]